MAENAVERSGRRGNPFRRAMWGSAAFLLLVPLVAMQFTGEVNWDETDFVVMGLILGMACGAYELATRMSGSRAYRAGVGVGVATAFLLVWINLAVGIIGSEDNSLNLLYGGVLAVALGGAAIARFRPAGTAAALAAAAAVQMMVAVVGLLAGEGHTLFLNAAFAALWLLSAWLFRKAARNGGAGTAGR